MNLSLLPKAACPLQSPEMVREERTRSAAVQPATCWAQPWAALATSVWTVVSGRGLCWAPDVSLAHLDVMLSGQRNRTAPCSLWGTQW